MWVVVLLVLFSFAYVLVVKFVFAVAPTAAPAVAAADSLAAMHRWVDFKDRNIAMEKNRIL
jgi:hypothetical protein